MIKMFKKMKTKRDMQKFNKMIEMFYNSVLSSENTKIEEQIINKKEKYKIAILIPTMQPYNGGLTSILRLGTYIAEAGHEVTYIAMDNMEKDILEKNALTNLKGYKGNMENNSALSDKYDIGISTFWRTCYDMLKYQDKFDYKMYFVQDFEPYFYERGDFYFMAENTYEMGFHMVSLGGWNKSRIEKEIDCEKIYKMDYIDFPVELKQYIIIERDIKIEKELDIAVYIKFVSKRAPYLLMKQLEFLKNNLKGYNLNINFFGIDKEVKLPFGNNLGKLNHDELKALYKKSHLGVVASLTNISLVNYEMMACGLPVIDYMEGSAPAFFTEEETIYINSQIDSIYNVVEKYLKEQNELNRIVKNGQEKIKKLSWEKSAKDFLNIIDNLK